MLRLERHRLGPRVYLCGLRIHEFALGFGLLAVLLLGCLAELWELTGRTEVAALLGAWLDWQGLARPVSLEAEHCCVGPASAPGPARLRCRSRRGSRFVFVAGLHRSGTTLLARLLAAHPEISGFSGTGAPADEGQHLQSVYPSDHEYGRPGRFGFAPEMHLTESSPLASEKSARTLFEQWSPHWDLSRSLLLEKSPPNLIKTRFLQALYPGAAFVVIVRHPIPVSIPTAKWRGTRRYDRMFEHWLHCHALFAADREHLDRVHVLTYEQLVRDPRACCEGSSSSSRSTRSRRSEQVEVGANEKYFRRWKALKHDPRMRAYLDLVSLKCERRVRPYGYSLLRPSATQLSPTWTSVSGPPNLPERTTSFAPRALLTRNAAAAALAVAALAGASYLGSIGLTTHHRLRPSLARSRNCEMPSSRPQVESCARLRLQSRSRPSAQ